MPATQLKAPVGPISTGIPSPRNGSGEGRTVGGRELILLVEDSPTQALWTRSILEGAGWAVEIRTSGSAAVSAAGELMPDLILLDIHLPDLNGREVSRR